MNKLETHYEKELHQKPAVTHKFEVLYFLLNKAGILSRLFGDYTFRVSRHNPNYIIINGYGLFALKIMEHHTIVDVVIPCVVCQRYTHHEVTSKLSVQLVQYYRNSNICNPCKSFYSEPDLDYFVLIATQRLGSTLSDFEYHQLWNLRKTACDKALNDSLVATFLKEIRDKMI